MRLPLGDCEILEIEEVLQELLTFPSEDRFGVELHSIDRKFPVAQAHDFAFWGLGLGRDFQAVGESFALYDERVVASGLEGIVEAFE